MEGAFARFQADLAGMGQGGPAGGRMPPPPVGGPGMMGGPPPMGMPPPHMGGPPGMMPPPHMMGMPPPPHGMPGPGDYMGMAPPGPGYGGPPPGQGLYGHPPPGPLGAGGPGMPYGTIASMRAGQGLGGSSGAHEDPDHGVPPQPKGHGVPPAKNQKKGLVREAGGERWRDPTLDEWPENDHRIFVGDLGNDVNDDVLAKAFQKYPSFAKAKIVKDKRTKKTKGYGFVSFLDSTDYAKALKEMNGKYVGNRPIKLRKSTWEERTAQVPANKKHKKQQQHSQKQQ